MTKSELQIFGGKEISFEKLEKEIQEKYLILGGKIKGESSYFDEIETEWQPALLKLVHPVTDDPKMPSGADTGDYFYDGGLIKRPCKFVVAHAHPSRVRFVQGEDTAPSCSSEKVDLKGRGEHDKSVSIYGDKCCDCPRGDQPYRHGKATSCSTQMNVIMIPETLEEIFLFRFAKSGWSVGSSLVDMAKAAPGGPWNRFFTLDSKIEKRQGGQGKYAVPVVGTDDDPVPEHLRAFAAFVNAQYKEFRATRRDMILERQDAVAQSHLADTLGEDEEDGDFKDGM